MYSRKTKSCPGCGKMILKTSSRCGRCSQLGSMNRNYKTGQAIDSRKCSNCGERITSSSKGLCQKCYTKSIQGKNNPNYRFGHYMRKFYNTIEYKNWRDLVYKRDNYKCQKCGNNKSGTLEAHHILPKRLSPSLVFDVNNGITLCSSCHEETFGKELDFVKEFLAIILAESKPRELGEGCNANTELSQESNLLESVETRSESLEDNKTPKRAGQHSEMNEDIVRTYENDNHKMLETNDSNDNNLLMIDNAMGLYVIGNLS